jgi:hypothetical protein
MMETKICKKCGYEKIIDDFPTRSDELGKRRGTCKECQNEYQRRYQVEHRERCEALRGVSRAKYREQIKARKKRYRKAHALRQAIGVHVTGRCTICGVVGHMILHHQDYNEPQMVDSLCQRCHMRVHAAVHELKRIAVRDSSLALAV